MAFSFDRRGYVNPNQATVDENRARMAEESRIIDEIIFGYLRKGASVEDAVAGVEGATLEQTNEWIAEGRITDPKYYGQAYRATDQDLH
jgi:hypothetical protein